jgi:parallel beta-helix repeat protein
MRSILRLVVAATAIATAGLLSAVVPVSAGDVVVQPHQSIQAAIDAAAPGSTVRVAPGTYRESLLIKKSLTVRGSGASAHGTILTLPSTTPPSSLCTGGPPGAPPPVVGICVEGKVDLKTFQVLERVNDVTITGFLVKGFTESGVMGVATERLRVKKVESDNNGGYGVFSLAAKHTLMSENRASGNSEAGFYLGDSPESDSRLEDNVATDNGFGVFMRDSTKVTATENRVSGNCIGVMALNTTPQGAGEYKIRDNKSRANDKFCENPEHGVAYSGTGIALIGVHGVLVTDNEVTDNHQAGQTSKLFTFPSAGVVVISFAGVAPSNNTVRDNEILRNQPFDIFWDKTGNTNVFKENDCRTSSPPGLCGGDHGDGPH